MSVQQACASPPPETSHRASFFRQSGWLMIANMVGGVFMWAVHFLSKPAGPTEYGIFIAFLAVVMCIPTIPLQMVMAQQTAKAQALNREGELTQLLRWILAGTFVLWLAGTVAAVMLRASIVRQWNLANPAIFWISLPVLLLSLWMPLFAGVLQGQQKFFWLGWTMLLNAVGRFGAAVFAVLALHTRAAGMMTGVLLGLAVAVVISVWQTRSLWRVPALPFDWRNVLRQIIPLMLGFGAAQFLFTADTMFAKSYFDAETVGFYGSAGTLSRALMWLVGPLAAVMFPRIVHSAARSEKSDLMGMVLAGTGVLAICGVLGLSILGPFVIKFVSGERFVKVAASLLPWYSGAMVPLALANVLLNNLLARSAFRIVPALCVLAAGYGFALTRFHETPVMVLQTLAGCNVLLLVLCVWYTWGPGRQRPPADSTPA